jgi:hypothetical protein
MGKRPDSVELYSTLKYAVSYPSLWHFEVEVCSLADLNIYIFRIVHTNLRSSD